jgi:hypothetical protein
MMSLRKYEWQKEAGDTMMKVEVHESAEQMKSPIKSWVPDTCKGINVGGYFAPN